LNADPVLIEVRGEYTKGGNKYRTFISKEAKEAIKNWLAVRGDYLSSARKRGRGLSKLGNGRGVRRIGDKRLFPFSSTVAGSMWNLACKKAGLDGIDESTGRHKFHIHMLRKFFRSQMGMAGVPRDVIEAMIGHEEYLDDAYRRFNTEQLAEQYQKGEMHLLVNESVENQIEVENKFDKQEQEINGLHHKLTDTNNLMIRFIGENEILKQKVQSMETLYNKLFEMSPEKFQALFNEVDKLSWEKQREQDKKQFLNKS
jgi:hypothetical protein